MPSAPSAGATTEQRHPHYRPHQTGQAVAAWAAAVAQQRPSALPYLVSALEDPDAGVRDHALLYLGKGGELSEELREAARRAADGIAGWRCSECDNDNGPTVHACTNCKTTGPNLDSRIKEALGS
jgi:hypothetical protein